MKFTVALALLGLAAADAVEEEEKTTEELLADAQDALGGLDEAACQDDNGDVEDQDCQDTFDDATALVESLTATQGVEEAQAALDTALEDGGDGDEDGTLQTALDEATETFCAIEANAEDELCAEEEEELTTEQQLDAAQDALDALDEAACVDDEEVVDQDCQDEFDAAETLVNELTGTLAQENLDAAQADLDAALAEDGEGDDDGALQTALDEATEAFCALDANAEDELCAEEDEPAFCSAGADCADGEACPMLDVTAADDEDVGDFDATTFQFACMSATDCSDIQTDMKDTVDGLADLYDYVDSAEFKCDPFAAITEDEASDNTAVIIVVVLGLLAGAGGTFFCYKNQKACFAPKEDAPAEGGYKQALV